MAALSISEAARTWGVHRASVKRWIKRGVVDATKDNAGVWRIAEGQQPPPTVHAPRAAPSANLDGPSAAPGRHPDSSTQGRPGADLEQKQDGAGAALGAHVAELTSALAEAGKRIAMAERDLAVSRREAELMRERMAELQGQHRERIDELRGALAAGEAERAGLQELLRVALDQPSWLERLVRALRSPRSGVSRPVVGE